MCIYLFVRSIAIIQAASALRVLRLEPPDNPIDRRAAKNVKFDPSQVLFESVKKNIKKQNKHKHKHGGDANILRFNEDTTPSPTDLLRGESLLRAVREENELKGINGDSSALLERPYIQHKGKFDFLVMKSEHADQFVTVVPNNMYYNVEKPCVNWLDSCTVQGIRAHLLQKVKSPYK